MLGREAVTERRMRGHARKSKLADRAGGKTRDRQRFRGALLLGAALTGVTGFLGSALIYGLDHYAW